MTARLLLDVREVGEQLGCGRTLVYQLIARGELPVVKLGRLTRIPASALETFVARRLEGPASAPAVPGKRLSADEREQR